MPNLFSKKLYLNAVFFRAANFLSCSDQQMLRLALLLSLALFPVAHSFNNFTSESLDVLLRDLAVKALLQHRPHTGALYNASLPANLAGMEVSVAQLRSKTLWSRGANFSHIHIPRRTLPMPYVRRILVVYQNVGNWSSYYYKVPGYSLVSSVVGFVAYDASNLSSKSSVIKLNLNTMGRPVEIRFPILTSTGGTIRRKMCAQFSADGKVYLGNTSLPDMCYGGNQGYFAIVALLKKRQRGVWDLWVMRGFVLGFVGLVLVCSVWTGLVKAVTGKRIREMEREADESVGLETIWIGSSSKMPSAAITRTHPVLENLSLS